MTPEKVREARQSLGLTQKEFGALLHSTERAARAWEAGNRKMTGATEELLKIKLREKKMKTAIKFYSGDLNNGDINAFDTYDAAYADYKAMAESCATTERGDEPNATPEEALQESMNFHYVRKEMITTDEDGNRTETSEILDGGEESH